MLCSVAEYVKPGHIKDKKGTHSRADIVLLDDPDLCRIVLGLDGQQLHAFAVNFLVGNCQDANILLELLGALEQ